MTTKVINNEKNAVQNVASANANKNVVDTLLKRFQKEGVLKAGAKGVKSDIYKKELFTEMLNDEKKAARRKYRKILQGLFISFKNAKATIEKEKVAKSFWDYYTTVYAVNDFTVASIAGGKIDEETKKVYEKYLPEIKKILNK